MKHRFTLIYELDCPVAVAVAAYLDAEHYAFLHSKYLPEYEVLSKEGRKIRIRQSWQYGGRKVSQLCTTEYVPPARFLNYDMSSEPWWFPTVHHVVTTKTDLRYYPDVTGQKTVSHLEVELDMPFVLWPLRKLLEAKLVALKKEKDREDVEMVERRAAIFGRGNIKSYLADHQFMLHKDDFVKHFGPGANAEAEAPLAAE